MNNLKRYLLIISLLLSACAQTGGDNVLPDDHGDTRFEATVVTGNNLTGILNYQTDIDVFQIEITSTGVSHFSSLSNFPVHISILDEAGTIFLSRSMLAPNADVAFSHVVGSFYVFIEAANTQVGGYSLNLVSDFVSVAGEVFGTLKFENQVPPLHSGNTVAYEDKACSYVRVQIVDSYGNIQADGLADAFGAYRFNLPATLNGTAVYLRMVSEGTRSTTSSVVFDATRTPFAVAGGVFVVNSSQMTQQDLVASAANFGAAFNILDNIVSAQDLLLNTLNVGAVPKIDVLWYPGNFNGTFFDPVLNQMFLFGMQSDNDGYDDSVILHEYGHFVLSNFSRDDSPGGMHTLTDTQQELTLAWSEGWATAWSCYVKLSRGDQYPEQYLDTDGSGLFLIEYEIEHVTQLGSLSQFLNQNAMGMANEIAVSSIIWDIVDTNNEPHDTINEPQVHWRTIQDLVVRRRVAMQDFLELWNGNALAPSIADLLFERSVYITPDIYEIDDVTPSYLSEGASQSHTFHYLADTDWVQVDLIAGQVYTFETLNLLSGADTILSIYTAANPASTLLASNDDRCGTAQTCTDRSSLVVYSPLTTGSYYLQVKRYLAPSTYNRYGSYELTYH